jgi:hypothetical protein
MTHNRYHPFKDHDEYARAALDGRLLLAVAGKPFGHVMPLHTAPVVVTKDLVDHVIEAHEERARNERIAQLEAEIAEEKASIVEQERDVAYLVGLWVGMSTSEVEG